jgi:imidazole glycerol-phosphate synthase subunit HisF
MLKPRLIPVLTIRNGGLVKTVGFSNHRYIGDPINAVKIFNDKEADELSIIDIDATVMGKRPDLSMIRRIAAESRMPLCYGGGVNSVEAASEIISSGVEKVAISSSALRSPQLVEEIATELGSQSISVALDVRKVEGEYIVFTHNGSVRHDGVLRDHLGEFERRGAGEIVLTNIDRDGFLAGLDLELAQLAKSNLRTPVTIVGGASSLENCASIVRESGVSGVGAGSLFVYKGSLRAVLINYPDPARKNAVLQPN